MTKLETEIDALKEKLRNELLELMHTKIDDKIKNVTDELKKTIELESNKATGSIYYLQGAQSLESKTYMLAILDYCDAASSLIKGEDEANGQKALNQLIDECLPNIRKTDFNGTIAFESSLNDLIVFLKSQNDNGRYSNYIEKIERGIKKAKMKTA